jgi:AbrB family looped-hinge helix DNA binding protein
MREYRAKMGENGRVVIPSSCRKKLHLVSGEDLILRVEENGLHLMTLKQSIKSAQAIVQGYVKQQCLTQKLRELRDEDEV